MSDRKHSSQHQPVRVAIAGLGRSGWAIHANCLASLPNEYCVVAVADADAGRREEAAARFHCRTHESFASLCADSDAELVIVATPNLLHSEHTIQALSAGKHVVCEKPMATGAVEAGRMIEAARRAKRMLTVFQNQRYNPGFMKVREVIASGTLGRVVLIRMAIHTFGRRWDWQTLKECGGGELNNSGAHFLDQALLLFGEAEPEIFCQLERTLASGDADDHCKIILRAPGAPLMDVEITRCCAYPQDLWLVMGTSGGLKGSAGRLSWRYVDFSSLPQRPVERRPTQDRSYSSEELPWQERHWESPQDAPSTPASFYRDLYCTIRDGKPPAVTPESVRRQIGILEKCHQLCSVV